MARVLLEILENGVLFPFWSIFCLFDFDLEGKEQES